MLKIISEKLYFKFRYIKSKKEILNSENMELISLLFFVCVIIHTFTINNAILSLCIYCEIFAIFSLYGIIIDIGIRFIMLKSKMVKIILVPSLISVFLITLFWLDMQILDIILRKNLTILSFLWFLLIRYYVVIYSMRKIIKLYKNETYRHITKMIIYIIVLSTPILAIGGFNLYFYHNKYVVYTYSDVIDEGRKILWTEHSHDMDQKNIFWIIGFVGVLPAKDLIDNAKDKVFILGIKQSGNMSDY